MTLFFIYNLAPFVAITSSLEGPCNLAIFVHVKKFGQKAINQILLFYSHSDIVYVKVLLPDFQTSCSVFVVLFSFTIYVTAATCLHHCKSQHYPVNIYCESSFFYSAVKTQYLL